MYRRLIQKINKAERKAVNKYYPPDWTPDKGSINKYVGQHPLRERAKKLGQGILVIRFELPYNIWCGGCGSHVGMGVRYNAEKKKVGNYYSTPIYRFRMKCHLCDNYFEIETDPKNCDYTVVSGARRKNETWEPSATETVETTDKEDAKRMAIDAMFKLEHGVEDVQKSKKAAPVLHQLQEVQSVWKDDYAANKLLRKKFREEKKNIAEVKKADDELRRKGSLDISLVPEAAEDIERAKKIKFYKTGFSAHKNDKRREIEAKSWFGETSCNPLATKLPGISLRKRNRNDSDEKSDWKKSVLLKTDSTRDRFSTTSGERTNENEGKRPCLRTNSLDLSETNSPEGHVIEHDSRNDEENNQHYRNEFIDNESRDEDVVVPSTFQCKLLDSSSKQNLENKYDREWKDEASKSRNFDKDASVIKNNDDSRVSKTALDGDSTQNCLLSLVSSLYSNESSDDD